MRLASQAAARRNGLRSCRIGPACVQRRKERPLRFVYLNCYCLWLFRSQRCGAAQWRTMAPIGLVCERGASETRLLRQSRACKSGLFCLFGAAHKALLRALGVQRKKFQRSRAAAVTIGPLALPLVRASLRARPTVKFDAARHSTGQHSSEVRALLLLHNSARPLRAIAFGLSPVT